MRPLCLVMQVLPPVMNGFLISSVGSQVFSCYAIVIALYLYYVHYTQEIYPSYDNHVMLFSIIAGVLVTHISLLISVCLDVLECVFLYD